MSLFARPRVLRTGSAAALFALLTLAGGAARADVVDIPPSCPDGAIADGCHSGPYCRALGCSDEEPCPPDRVCKEVDRCTQQFACGGGLDTGDMPIPFDNILSECGEGGQCSTGTCKTLKLCVSESTTTSDSASGGTPTGTGEPTASGGNSDSGGSTASGGSDSSGEPMKKELGCGCRTDGPGAPALLLLGLLGLSWRQRR